MASDNIQARVCCGMFTCAYSRCSRYDVADVDSVGLYLPDIVDNPTLTADRFGIMLGNVMGVAFGGLAPDLGWYVATLLVGDFRERINN